MAARPRIAVTGVGLVSSLGVGRHEVFRRVCAGERGLAEPSLFDSAGQRSRLAGEVRGLDVAHIVSELGASSGGASRSDAFALLAAREALAGAPSDGPLGVVLGGTTGGMYETELGLSELPAGPLPAERVRRLLDFPLSISAERLSRALGAQRSATLSSACASGALALILGAAWLLSGRVRRVLAGGMDSLCQLTFSGFNALGAADPEPCRPFDVGRAGLNLGEGAGFLLLELEVDARRREAPIFGWLSGWAHGSEAHHITQPEPSGARAATLMREAMSCAGLSPRDIDYVNAHGTGTQQNDAMEALALEQALGAERERVWVSSCKAQLGHTLGASGAIEAALTVLALEAGVVLPAVGLGVPEARTLRFAPATARASALRAALSNSFGFGGSCAVLALEAPSAAARELAAPIRPTPVLSAAAVLGSAPEKSFARDPLASLDPERSRRFGRASALVCSCLDALLAGQGSLGEAGLVVSSAFGDVERSVRFIRRVLSGGPRLASPAEFPQLLASSVSGNGSLYRALRGPCLTVSEGGSGGELALSIALALLELEPARALIAGGAEAFDPIVDELLAPEAAAPRAEGAGFVLLEDEARARAAGRRPLARVVEHAALRGDRAAWTQAVRSLPAPKRAERAGLFCVAPPPWLLEALALSSWAQVARSDPSERFGYHEALGALALGAAAQRIAARELDEALLVRALGDALYLTQLGAPELEP